VPDPVAPQLQQVSILSSIRSEPPSNDPDIPPCSIQSHLNRSEHSLFPFTVVELLSPLVAAPNLTSPSYHEGPTSPSLARIKRDPLFLSGSLPAPAPTTRLFHFKNPPSFRPFLSEACAFSIAVTRPIFIPSSPDPDQSVFCLPYAWTPHPNALIPPPTYQPLRRSGSLGTWKALYRFSHWSVRSLQFIQSSPIFLWRSFFPHPPSSSFEEEFLPSVPDLSFTPTLCGETAPT